MDSVKLVLFIALCLVSVNLLAWRQPSGDYCMPISDGWRVLSFHGGSFKVAKYNHGELIETLQEKQSYLMTDKLNIVGSDGMQASYQAEIDTVKVRKPVGWAGAYLACTKDMT